MKDPFGREIDYIRVSVTDRCNLRCKYCMPEELPSIPHDEILRYEEIERVCAAAASLGIRNIRVTGGEPLVRPGCMDLLRSLKALQGTGRLLLTTNGVLLEKYLPELVEIGIDGINVSLDTLDRATYRELTGRDVFNEVFHAIEAALEAGLRVKVNCVTLRGYNDHEFLRIAGLAERYPLDVRFIESMPIGAGEGFDPVPSTELIGLLRERYPDLTENMDRRGFGPARYYTQDKLQGGIGFIDAVSHGFCKNCNRIRLTSDGFLKTCLYFNHGADLKTLMRQGGGDDELESAIREAIAQKPERHVFYGALPTAERRNMSQIGG